MNVGVNNFSYTQSRYRCYLLVTLLVSLHSYFRWSSDPFHHGKKFRMMTRKLYNGQKMLDSFAFERKGNHKKILFNVKEWIWQFPVAWFTMFTC